MENGELYRPWIIKEYEYWTLLLHLERPLPYIGRTVAWWKDCRPHEGEGMSLLEIVGAPIDELLRKVYVDVHRGCRALGHAVDKLGTEFLINVSYLANEESHNHHMHWHFVPRWKEPFRAEALGGRIVKDPCWGAHYQDVYATNRGASFTLPEDDLQRIRHIMADAVN